MATQGAKSDVTAGYRAAAVDLIRTHDAFGAGDIDAHFGAGPPGLAVPEERNALTIFPDMNADANDPASYRFAPTDRLIASIRGAGAEPLFRIGRSIGADPTPPPNPDKYALIAQHIVRHYNQGWDHGFHDGIRYWEIWNEPDFKFFWTGSADQYYALYEKTARAIKAADPKSLVGGPTIAKPLDAGAYREDFLAFVRAKQLPLDFFPWHYYTMDANDPNDFVRIAHELRSVLDKNGFTHTQSILDEWNTDLFDRQISPAMRASFVASSLIYMLNAPIDKQAYYRADDSFRGNSGQPDQVAHAITAFGRMKETPVLLKSEGADDNGLALLAGRSDDSRTLQILISNYQIPAKYLGARAAGDHMQIPNVMDLQLPSRRSIDYNHNAGYDLTIKLPKGNYRVQRYRITDAMNDQLVDSALMSGPSIHLQAALPPPGIEFIVLTAEH
jgi:xylan 1,4-beta-xylosidase